MKFNPTIQKNIRLLTWFNFFTDFRPYSPIAIIYFSQITGSYALGLTIFSISSISSAIFEVPTGIWSDLVGRKKTIIVGSIASIFGLIFYALGGSFWVLAMGAILEGLALSLFSGNNDALLHDTLLQNRKQKQFSKILGKTHSMFQIGLAISALLGGFLAGWSFSIVMWVLVIPQIICLFIAFQMIEPEIHGNKSGNIFAHLKEAFIQFRQNVKLRNLSIATALNEGIGETVHQFTPAFFALLWPTWAIGVARALTNAFAATSFWYSGDVIKKLGALKSLLFGQLFSRSVGLIAFNFVTIFSPVLIALQSLVYGTHITSKNTLGSSLSIVGKR